MPKEKPIIPYGIPNPIGPAIIPGTRNKARIGGEVPKERYPLVCHRSLPYQSQETPLNMRDWNRLKEIIAPVSDLKEDAAKERLEKLKQQSLMLQMGWPDNNKDQVKRLAEKFLCNTQKDRDIKEIEERKQIAERKPKKSQGWPKTLTSNDERHVELQSAVIMSECLAQRDEHARIANEYKQLCAQRDEFDAKQRDEYNQRMTENQTFREQRRKAFLKDVEMFQDVQAAKKKTDDREFKEITNKNRISFVLELADNARAKAFHDLKEENGNKKVWLQSFRDEITNRAEIRKKHQELDNGLLDMAYQTEEQFYQTTAKQKQALRSRTIANGAKQYKACQWLKENVFDKVVDKEDDRIQNDMIKDEYQYRQEQESDRLRKEHFVQSLIKFHQDDQRIKQNRKTDSEMEKKRDYAKNMVMFEQFIDHVGVQNAKQLSAAQLYARFWDDQCVQLSKDRRATFQYGVDLQAAIKHGEALDEDHIEQLAEDLMTLQTSKGKVSHTLKKSKDKLSLGKGPPLMAGDNFDHKLYCETKDIFYKPVHSRNRMSINWNPKK